MFVIDGNNIMHFLLTAHLHKRSIKDSYNITVSKYST